MNQNDPYKTPDSQLEDKQEYEIALQLQPPRSVNFLHGLRWYLEGFQFFIKSPGVWIAMTVLFVLMIVLVSLIPMPNEQFTLGNLLDTFLLGGLMLGMYTLDRSGRFGIEFLIAAFKHPMRMQLLIVACLSFVIYGMVSYFLLHDAMLTFKQVTQSPEGAPQVSVEEMLNASKIFYLAVFKTSLLSIPVMALFWFTAPLIVLHRVDALTAMKLSFLGCVYNVPAFIMYILVGAVLAVLATLLLGLGWFVLFPVIVASQYLAWKDIFTNATRSG